MTKLFPTSFLRHELTRVRRLPPVHDQFFLRTTSKRQGFFQAGFRVGLRILVAVRVGDVGEPVVADGGAVAGVVSQQRAGLPPALDDVVNDRGSSLKSLLADSDRTGLSFRGRGGGAGNDVVVAHRQSCQ